VIRRPQAGRFLALLGIGACIVALVLTVRSTEQRLAHPHPGQSGPAASATRPPAPPRGGSGAQVTAAAHGLSGVEESLERAGEAVWHVVRLLLVGIMLLAGCLVGSRARARRRRRYMRLWLIPHRASEAESGEVRRMLESWHQQLIERWWRRLVCGQPGLALEIVMGRDREGDYAAGLSVVCPEAQAASVEGTLLACYPDARIVAGRQELPPVREIVRLKKRHVFVQALQSPERDDDRNLVDSVLNQMASLRTSSVLQYTLTPAPLNFERYARRRFSALERASEGRRAYNPSDPGLRSEVLGQELTAGLKVQHRPLFFTDIRIASTSYRAAAAIAATVRGESGAENRLVERYMRPWARGRLYLRRLQAGVGNPIPGWHHGVVSSSELGRLWQLPSPGLKLVRIVRSGLPRIPASPEISRASDHMLARDERGPVGIRPEDKTDGLGLIGGQKTGKTSLLCRTVEADAGNPECAVVVMMPKPGDALQALSVVDPSRTVHYLDLEHPEFGINPLISPGEPGMIADRVVEAFRDVNAEGDIRGSSDRYLRQAAQAAIGASRAGVVEGPPTLWHMYRMLIPIEKSFRERVVEALYPDPRFTDTATFFGRELPSDLSDAPGQTTAKLDAPRNKLLRLLVGSLDKVLRHPVQLSIDDIIRRREVLIVDGKMGTFGTDNCRVMMQFILNILYGALQRQQQLPVAERVRVALKVDEAHLVLNQSFADALATLRSAGLEVVAAWQYGEQIEDLKVRSGMMSLLRQRCMFSMGEADDAREMSRIAMSVYSDLIRDDTESRARLRITPDTIFNLPNHHAVCSWISRGARAPAFIAQTLPLELRQDVIDHHLSAQRQRGCHEPDRLPDPLPDLDWTGLQDLPSVMVEPGIDQGATPIAWGSANGHGDGTLPGTGLPPVIGAAAGRQPDQVGAPRSAADARAQPAAEAPGDGSEPVGAGAPGRESEGAPEPAEVTPEPAEVAGPVAAAGVALDFNPGASSVSHPNERAVAPSSPVPDGFLELQLDEVRGVIWDKVVALPGDRRHEPSQRELEILGALWSYRFLFASQIWRRWWAGSSLRATQQGLNRMTKAGWVRRFKFQLGQAGSQQRVYCLTKDGFELAQQRTGRHGPYINPDAQWREQQISDPRRVMRDLHVNAWVMAFETCAGRSLAGWRGAREAKLTPPRRKTREGWKDLAPSDIVVGSSYRLRDLRVERFEAVSPDATLELRINVGGSALRFDLMVELDRVGSAAAAEDRLRRYDGLISGWSGMLSRYQALGTPPMVVFLCEDEPSALSLVRIADRAITARLAKPGTGESEWPFPGRRAMFFAVERDMHMGSMQALQVPELPPELRIRLHGPAQKACRPRRVHIVEPRLLRAR
jgi:hypothetical protein